MRIYEGDCDQSDRRFGARAGSQCMSNCFVFLHAAYLKSTKELSVPLFVNSILREGAVVDKKVEGQLISSQPGKKLHPYRLTSEIPNVITTTFGCTGHLLSKAFSGTTETQHLDGYTCLSVFDFFLYANKKTKPTFILITVGAITRAAILDGNSTYYLFDPHSSTQSQYAAIFQCDSLDEIVNIVIDGTASDTFYYDAAFVFFMSVKPVREFTGTLAHAVISKYQDADITEIPAEAKAFKIQETKERAPKRTKTSPPAHRSPKKKNTQDDYSSVNFEAASLTEYGLLLQRFEDTVAPFIVRAPPTCGWTLYSNDGLPFEKRFFNERLRNIMAQNVDTFTDAMPCQSDDGIGTRTRAFGQFVGFSDHIDKFVRDVIRCDFSLIKMYASGMMDPVETAPLNALLAAKAAKAFSKYTGQHRDTLTRWLTSAFGEGAALTSVGSVLNVDRVVNNHPFPLEFVCLCAQDKNTLSLKIDSILQSAKRALRENRELYSLASQAIASINLGMLPSELSAAARQLLGAMKNCDAETRAVLKANVATRLRDLERGLRDRLAGFLHTRINDIVTGMLPDNELQIFCHDAEAFARIAHLARESGLCEEDFEPGAQELYDNAAFLRTGAAQFSDANVSNEIKTIRGRYVTALDIASKAAAAKVDDVLSSMEEKLSDTRNLTRVSIELMQKQLSELKRVDVNIVSNGLRRLQAVEKKLSDTLKEDEEAMAFISELSGTDMPSVADLRRVRRLGTVLASDVAVKNKCFEKILSLLNEAAANLLHGDFRKDDFFSSVKVLVTYADANSPLLDFADVIQKISHKLHLYNSKKDPLNANLTDVISFFVENERRIKEMIDAGCGATLVDLYKKLKTELEENVLRDKESEWCNYVKGTEVSSERDMQLLLASAPSKEVAEKMLPDIVKKLQEARSAAEKKEDGLRKMREADLERTIKNLSSKIIAAVRTATPSLVSVADLETLKDALEAAENGEQHAIQFNSDLREALAVIGKRINQCEDAIIPAILANDGPAVISGRPSVGTVLDATALLRRVAAAPTLLPETARDIATLLKDAECIRRATITDDAAAIFLGSKHEKSFTLSMRLKSMITAASRDARETVEADFTAAAASVDASAATINKLAVATPTVSAAVRAHVADDLGPAFRSAIDKLIAAEDAAIAQEVAVLNSQLKAKIENHNALLQSRLSKWHAVVNRHRLDKPQDVTVDAAKLRDDTADTLSKLLADASQKMPYVQGEKATRWALGLLDSLMTEIDDDPRRLEEFTVLSKNAEVILQELSGKAETNAACEMAATDKTSRRPGDLHRLEAMLLALDGKRVVGGETRYKQLLAIAAIDKSAADYVEQYTKLSLDYEDLRNAIRTYAYGLDFDKEETEVESLRAATTILVRAYAELQKSPNAASELAPADGIASALQKLHDVVRFRRLCIGNLVQRQPWVARSVSDVCLSIPSEDPAPDDEMLRLRFLRKSGSAYEVVNAFNKKEIVAHDGTPLRLQMSFRNAVFKFFALSGDKAFPQASPEHSSVTAKYKADVVSASIAQSFSSFWNQLETYAAKRPADRHPGKPQFNILSNLKLFSNVMAAAWSSAAAFDDQLSNSKNDVTLISLMDFTILMAAMYPEYVLGATVHPTNVVVNSIAGLLDRSHVFSLMTVTSNPVPAPMGAARAFCIDPNQWQRVDVSRSLWNGDLVKQLCGDSSPEGNGIRKLFQYLLAAFVIPPRVLHYAWARFRPAYASGFETAYEFVSALLSAFLNQYEIREEVPKVSAIKGLKVTREFVLLDSVTQDGLFDDFADTDAVLDYVLGSYVFGVELTCSIHVTEILNKRRRLLVRHLENVRGNTDFETVLQTRHLALNQMLEATWTGAVLEQSWFKTQMRRVRAELSAQRPATTPVPLLIYDLQDNTILAALQPPSVDGGGAGDPLRFAIDGAFLLRLEDTTAVCSLASSPTDTDFLNSPPPPLNAGGADRTDDSEDAYSEDAYSEDADSETDDETDRPRRGDGAPKQAHAKTVSVSALDDPAFKRSEVDRLVLKSDVTILSPESSMTDFPQHPVDSLSTNIGRAVGLLREIQNMVVNLTDYVTDTIRRLRIMYIY